jgi:geranylgeranyl diphosphate synthase type II
VSARRAAGAEDVEKVLRAEAVRVETRLDSRLRADACPPGLLEAVRYSLFAGGKRLRPVLCLLSSRVPDRPGPELDDAVLTFACALECIHTYSLIHDDLPAMDDDDFRRGRPSCHKRFNEASAILAGDALLTDAFALAAGCAGPALPAERVLRAVAAVAGAAGSSGMVGGQFLDMLYMDGRRPTPEELAAMQAMKTGAMLRLPCTAGAVLAGAPPETASALSRYGEALGAAFQIIDDILDVTGDAALLGKPVGSDDAARKWTYPALLGLKKSREIAELQTERAVAALDGLQGESAALLRGLAVRAVDRVS